MASQQEYQIPTSLRRAENGEFLNRMFQASSAAVMGMRGEKNPLNQFMGMGSVDMSGRNPEARWAQQPITLMNLEADQAVFYHDNRGAINYKVADYVDENRHYTPQRSTFTVSSKQIVIDEVFKTIPNWKNAKLNVSWYVNLSHDIGDFVAGMIGDMMMATLLGYRGPDGNIYMGNRDMIDQPGDSFETMAGNKYFQNIINPLQGDGANAATVAPVARKTASWLAGDKGINLLEGKAIDLSAATGSADDVVKFEDMREICTTIKKWGNENRTALGFEPAQINKGVYADGGQMTRMDTMGKKYMVAMTNHDVIQDLQQDENWQKLQFAYAEGTGRTTGLVDNETGIMRGVIFHGWDKFAQLKGGANNDVRISPIHLMGKAALVMMFSRGSRAGWDFGGVQNPRMRRFMETPMPINISLFPLPGANHDDYGIAVKLPFGIARPTFKDNNGDMVDYGNAQYFVSHRK